jgi:phage protein U
MATPMLDDLELKAVQWIREETDAAFARQRVVGLDGTLHQKIGRASHRVTLAGAFLPATATDDLKQLQTKAAAGGEITFTADIATALDVQKYVIESIAAEQLPGASGQFTYRIVLSESPPLPPPAEVSSFGGLGGADGFGLGDLGFDPSALGGVMNDIADAAGGIMAAADGVLDAVKGIAALGDLGNLANIGNPVAPLVDKVKELEKVGPLVAKLGTTLGKLTS